MPSEDLGKLGEFLLIELTTAPTVVINDECHDSAFFIAAAVVGNGTFVKKKNNAKSVSVPTLSSLRRPERSSFRYSGVKPY
jgi:hypothetical protein